MNSIVNYQEQTLVPYFNNLIAEAKSKRIFVKHIESLEHGFPSIILITETLGVRKYIKAICNPVRIEQREIVINKMATIQERNSEIKRLYNFERLNQVEIGEIMGLTQSQISRILRS